jgi:hypothetical protein
MPKLSNNRPGLYKKSPKTLPPNRFTYGIISSNDFISIKIWNIAALAY